jgi:beta-ribofuranosylaminobenzene 5'-phosphate synthase
MPGTRFDMPHKVQITAPGRLHFGLWSLGGDGERQFGGVGAMIQRPGLRLTIEPAVEFYAAGPLKDRALVFARRWAEFHSRELPLVRISVDECPPEHIGLGTGTQLGLAIAAGMNAYAGLPNQTPQELAISVGRGQRSAVGTYGFAFGGLVVEQGKLSGEPISPLDCRIDLPADWRFVLVRQADGAGLAGEDEISAMMSLPPVPAAVTSELIGIVRDRIVPAAATVDFMTFAKSLHAYGRLSGQCFAARQGGPYNGPALTELVERILKLGYPGVGQSSWGPTLFIVVPRAEEAEALVASLHEVDGQQSLETVISPPCNRGALVTVRELGEAN